jgi:hypothetical protein
MRPQNDGYASVHTVRIPLWPYLVAPLFCLVALPATWGVHRAYGTSAASAGWTGVAVAFASVGILLFTFFLSRPRGVVMQVMATINAGLAIAWCIPAILEGPFTKPKFGFWLLFALVISFDCALYRIMRQARGDDGSHGQVLNGELAELGDAVKQLKGVRFGRPVVDGAKVTAAIEMPPGRSFEEVQAAKREVASLLDVRATSVRTIGDPDSERSGTVHVVPRDQLRDAIPDPGIEPGLSIADPIVLGLADSGEPAQIILPGDPAVHRNAVGVMGVVGMSGSGKTELLLRFVKEAVTRPDNDTYVIDCRKSGQLPGWVKRAATRAIDDSAEALDFLEDLERRIADRSKQLGARGLKQWERGCGIQFETYVIFEAASFIRESNIVDLSEAVRSVGMCVVLELQRATYDRLPTSARSNMTTWCVLGVQNDGDAEGALPDEVAAAGAAPWKWKNGKPGYFYLLWSGRDEESWSAPCRSFIQHDADRERDVAAVLGWNDAGREEPTQVEPYTPPRGGQEPDLDDAEDDDDEGVPPGVDPDDPPDDVDPSEPIVVPPGMPRIPFGDDRKKMLPAEALGLLRSHVFALMSAGAGHVEMSDLADVLAQTGLSSSWMRNALRQLCDEGVLREPRPGERGVWRVVQRERMPAAAGSRP